MDNEFLTALNETFSFNKPAKKVVETLTPPAEKKTYITRNSVERGLGDPTVTAAAQSVYNPNQPVAPSPKAPATTVASQGVSQNMGKQEGWGKTV